MVTLPITASEYRKKVIRKKTVTLPSDISFEIRAFGALDYWNIKGIESVVQGKNIDPKANLEFFKMVLTKCVLNPRIVLDNPKENELLIDEIDNNDATAIVNEVLALSINKENVNFLAEKGK